MDTTDNSMNSMDSMYFGCHMPNQNANILLGAKSVKNLGGNCMQIFVANPMNGRVSDKHFAHYKTNSKSIKQELSLANVKVFIHSSYTYNFAKPKESDKSWSDCFWISNYLKELEIAHEIGAVGCVIHVGKYLKLNPNIATDIMFDSLSYVIDQIKSKNLNSVIILETCAGQGTELFRTRNNSLAPFADFYNKFSDNQKKYIKICVDTCHIFAAGYDIRNKYQVAKLFADFESTIGLKYLYLIHLNDSKKDYNTGVDRHENIGKGFIGTEGLGAVIENAAMYNIPLILETPDNDDVPPIVASEIAFINKIVDSTQIKYTNNSSTTNA